MTKIDDIINRREKEDKEKAKREIRGDINDLVEGVYNDFEDLIKRKKIEKDIKAKKQTSPIKKIINFMLSTVLSISVVLFIINFLLGNFLLLKFIWGRLF